MPEWQDIVASRSSGFLPAAETRGCTVARLDTRQQPKMTENSGKNIDTPDFRRTWRGVVNGLLLSFGERQAPHRSRGDVIRARPKGSLKRQNRRIGTIQMRIAARLETIQFLRGVAVVVVVISHAMHELAALLEGHLRSFDEKRFPGDFGVDLFFVISGFIMVYVCRDLFARPGAMADFVRRRLVRIVPLYWIMTTMMIGVVVLLPNNVDTATNDPGQWLASYFFIPYQRLSDGLVRPVLGLGWSLQYEMLFYGLFALGLLFPRRYAIPLVTGLIFAAWFVGDHLTGAGALAQFLSRPIIFEFVAGMFLGWVFVAGQRVPLNLCLGLGIIGVGLLFAAPAFDDIVDLSRHIVYGIPALLILAAFILPPEAEHVRVGRAALEVGETSFATYLTHPFVLGLMSLVASRLDLPVLVGPQIFSAGYVIVACLACVTVGYLVHHHLDLPLTRRIGVMLPQRPAATGTPVANRASGSSPQTSTS